MSDTLSNNNDNYVYLDYAATAPLCEEAARAFAQFMQPGSADIAAGGANANSLHGPGRRAFALLEQARRDVAQSLHASRPSEIVFTSGATESDNTALIGLVHACQQQRQKRGIHQLGHVIVSSIEHDAVLAPARRLEKEGVRVTYLPVTSDGFVTEEALRGALSSDTLLVSVMMANSEVGSIQPIARLAKITHNHDALFHTDATQALGKIPVNLQELDVDAASFSGHKIGSVKGSGVMYLRARTPFEAYLLGGGQEEGRRSGTQNVAAACAFAAACRVAVEKQEEEQKRLGLFRDELYEQLLSIKRVSSAVSVTQNPKAYLPNIVHVLVSGFESETLIIRLDEAGFAVSGGSACSSHSLDISHVLKAMGVAPNKAQGALRVSMGCLTTQADINAFAKAFTSCIQG